MKLNLNHELSEYIKLIRFKNKKSQEDMGNSLKVSRNTYSIWENNPIKLSLDTLIEIGTILETDILIFFNEYVAKCKILKEDIPKEKDD